MIKPASLREHLTAALPQLRRDPEKLVVLASSGRAICTGTGSLSFEYAYTLQIILLDYAGHADAVIVPLLAWVAVHQPELLANADRRDRAIRFEINYLTEQTIDLSIEIELTERVLVRPREGAPGGLNLVHVVEPPSVLLHTPAGRVPPPYDPLNPADPHNPATSGAGRREHWTLWLKDELLAEWAHDPR